MARVCELTGKGPHTGNRVSHSNIKTRTVWNPNIFYKKYQISELSQAVTLRLSASAIRTIDKLGSIENAILKGKEPLMSDRLLKLKRSIIKRRKEASGAPKAKKTA